MNPSPSPGPSLLALLGRHPDLTTHGLVSLLRADQSCRWGNGDRVLVEQYLAVVPGLAGQRDALLDLIYSEFLLREGMGDAPKSAEYAERFPDLAEHLRRRFALHREVLSMATAETVPPHVAVDEHLTQDQSPEQRVRAKKASVERPGVVSVPGYEILGELGRGGMGVVYKATQVRAGRAVALKMMLAAGHADADERDRFKTEAEAVARLQHPGVVQVFEVGEHDGLPFFSMEFCEGGSLKDKLADEPLAPKEAAELVEKLAVAVEAAHLAGVIHRDLKPANVLLVGDGTPKVTDFGLAKKLDEAGRPPFLAPTVMVTLSQVLHQEPVPVRQFQPNVAKDLETICLKCLSKESARRYGSAAALAEDLGRFRAGEPIAARPVGAWERGWRWCRRNPAVAGLLAAVAAVLLLGTGISTGLGLYAYGQSGQAEQDKQAAQQSEARAKEEEEKAKARTREKEEQLTFSKVALAAGAWREEQVALMQDSLDEVPAGLRNWEWRYLKRVTQGIFTLYGHTERVTGVEFSPDGTRLATASWDRTAKVWDARAGRELLTLEGHTELVHSVAFCPDGTRLATGGGVVLKPGEVKVWDARAGRELLTLEGHTDSVHSVAFSADGTRLATASQDRTARVWDARAGQDLLTLRGHRGPVHSVAFSPDGRYVIGGATNGKTLVWDVQTGQVVPNTQAPTALRPSSLSPDGQLLALISYDTVRLMSLQAPDAWELGGRMWNTRFDPSWHADRADHPDLATNPFARAFHREQLLAADPSPAEHVPPLLQALAEAARQHPGSSPYQRRLALAQLFAGQPEAAQETCAAMRQRFAVPAPATQAGLLFRAAAHDALAAAVTAQVLHKSALLGGASDFDRLLTARACVLHPQGLPDSLAWLTAVPESEPLTRAALLCRAGEHAEAIDLLQPLKEPRAHLWRALAEHGRGDKEAARMGFDEALAEMERLCPSDPEIDATPVPWEHRAEYHILKREAQFLFKPAP